MSSYLLLLFFKLNSIIDNFNIYITLKTIFLIITMTETIIDFIDGKEIYNKVLTLKNNSVRWFNF